MTAWQAARLAVRLVRFGYAEVRTLLGFLERGLEDAAAMQAAAIARAQRERAP